MALVLSQLNGVSAQGAKNVFTGGTRVLPIDGAENSSMRSTPGVISASPATPGSVLQAPCHCKGVWRGQRPLALEGREVGEIPGAE